MRAKKMRQDGGAEFISASLEYSMKKYWNAQVQFEIICVHIILSAFMTTFIDVLFIYEKIMIVYADILYGYIVLLF